MGLTFTNVTESSFFKYYPTVFDDIVLKKVDTNIPDPTYDPFEFVSEDDVPVGLAGLKFTAEEYHSYKSTPPPLSRPIANFKDTLKAMAAKKN